MMKRTRLIITFVLFILLAFVYSVNRLGSLSPSHLKELEVGRPIIWEEEKTIRSEITQIVSEEDSVYILYGRYGVVQEYDIKGMYKCSYAVYCHPNGRIRIATSNGMLYVRDKVDNVYVFSHGAFLNFFPSDTAASITSTFDFDAFSHEFEVRLGCVFYHTNEHESNCIINRPVWLTVYQNNLAYYMQFLLVLLLCVINIKRK